MDWKKINENFNTYLKDLFHAEEWEQRAEAAREIGLMRDARATNLLCRALRTEDDHMVVNRIIEALGRIGDPKATTRVLEKLEEELDKFEGDKFRLVYILEALTNLKDKRALPKISSFLNSPDEDLKKLAIKAFDTIEPKWREIVEEEQKKKDIGDIFRKYR
ncbi:MAG: HEAT repeat domain-containing protein [Promethearchaeota archaeon]|nr:MAG: HEAT repeat domain-containing protein [Candidatus Lokiarchaeota archaeon]